MGWNPAILAEQSSLAILRIPENLDLADGFVTEVDVVVGNSGPETLNMTLCAKQDRSPHEAIPVEPLPSAVISADSNATLVLRLLGAVWHNDLENSEWTGSVSTGVYVRAITADGNVSSDVELITVRISFLRPTSSVFAAVGMICCLMVVLCLCVRRRRRVRVI